MKNTVLFLALFTLGTILSAEEWKTSRRSLWEAEGENHYSCNLSGTEKKWNVIINLDQGSHTDDRVEMGQSQASGLGVGVKSQRASQVAQH